MLSAKHVGIKGAQCSCRNPSGCGAAVSERRRQRLKLLFKCWNGFYSTNWYIYIYNHVFSFERLDVVTVSYSPANQIVTQLSGEEMRLWKNMRVTDVVCMSAPCLADYVGQCGFGYDPWRCLFQCGNFPASTKTFASNRLSCAQKHFPNMNNRIQIYTCFNICFCCINMCFVRGSCSFISMWNSNK